MVDLLILCCFGGVPFIEFPTPSSPSPQQQSIRHQWDPTDWVATDMSGSLLNASVNSALLAANPALKTLIPLDLPAELSLEQCDLWNLTFASGADEHVFRRTRGRLECRCPPKSAGSACHKKEINNNSKQEFGTVSPGSGRATTTNNSNRSSRDTAARTPLPFASSNGMSTAPLASSSPLLPLLSSTPLPSANSLINGAIADGLSRNQNSFAMFLLVFMLLAAAMVALFLMLRGCCFCDCFGGFGGSNRRRYDQPLDRQTVNVCMEAVRTYEQNEKSRWAAQGQWSTVPAPPPTSVVVDSRRPLLPQPPAGASHLPSVSEFVPIPPPRACSPPPSYRSSNTSLEQIPGAAQNSKI